MGQFIVFPHFGIFCLQEKADPESKETKKMYMSVLNTEKTFVKVSVQKGGIKENLYLR